MAKTGNQFLLFANKSRNAELLFPDIEAEILQELSRGLWMGFLLNSAIFIPAYFEPVAVLILNFCMWIFRAGFKVKARVIKRCLKIF
jgi:hypothetical protein